MAINDQGYDANKEGTKEDVIAMPLKYLSSFWRTLDIPLINCEISLTLSWSSNCVIISVENRIIVGSDPIQRDRHPRTVLFNITDCKLYVPVVTLLIEEDNKLLEQLESGFKKTIKWNKYMSQMSNQTANNNLNCLIDPTFTNVIRLFVLSFENEGDRTSFFRYHLPKIEIKDYNVLIDGKPFFEIPVKK